MENKGWDDPLILGTIAIEVGRSLLQSGASSERIRTSLDRFFKAGGFDAHIEINPLSVSVNLNDANGHVLYNGTGSIAVQGVNFKVLTGISQLSWEVHDNKVGPAKAREKLKEIVGEPHYNRWLNLLFVSLAGAAFCFTFGGNAIEMAVGFLATFLGLFCKQQMLKKHFNTYIITFISAACAGFVVGSVHFLVPEVVLEHAFATCVLFLIPGVPLINAVTDILEGYTINGVARGVGALVHALAIAFGLIVVLKIFGYV
ncbi:MAG: threonine/serine exporter family protein [Chitinophagaceae bacterium]|nr:threonine/serine exporter family protein [Chitinophagaceae bacterium]